ncbi:MAG: FtsX-like permease family protein [Bryobacteraceae bacterium]
MKPSTTGFELFVARRYLRAKRKQAVISIITVISVLGVAAGVMALVIALAINNGFRNMLQGSLLGAYAHVNVMEKEPGPGIEDWPATIAKLRKLPHVVAASPALYGQVYLIGASPDGAVLKGIQTEAEVKTSDMLRNLKAGSLENLKANAGLPGIILGTKLAQTLGTTMNGVIKVICPDREITPFGPRSEVYRFRVVGLFESGFYEIDSAWAFTSLGSAQTILSVGDVVNSIELKLDDIYRAPEVARLADRATGPRLAAQTWMEQNKHILSALNMEKAVTWVTIGLIVLVAALNILITLAMMVMEKYRDIAILVSMGAQAAQIRRVFQFQGVLIGAVGTALGLAAGHTLSFLADKYRWIRLDEEVYQLSYVPFDPRWVDSIWIAALAILISFVATLYPARAASRIAPAEALRYE